LPPPYEAYRSKAYAIEDGEYKALTYARWLGWFAHLASNSGRSFGVQKASARIERPWRQRLGLSVLPCGQHTHVRHGIHRVASGRRVRLAAGTMFARRLREPESCIAKPT